MAAEGSVTISYEQHNQMLVDGLWNFLSTKYRVEDVPWGGGYLKAHRLILEVFLPPKIPMEGVTVSDDYRYHLEVLLEFLYRGSVTVKREKLDGLLLLAREMEFQMLVDAVLASSSGQSKTKESEGWSRDQDIKSDPKSSGNVKIELWEPEIEIEEVCGSDAKRERLSIEPWEPNIEISEGMDNGQESSNEPWEPEIEVVVGNGNKRKQPNASVVRRPGGLSTVATARLKVAAKRSSANKGMPLAKFKCPECPFESSNAMVLKSHQAVVHSGEMQFKCDHCGFATFLQSVLKKHVNTLHPGSLRQFSYANENKYDGGKMHGGQTAHDEVEIFKCSHCIQAFTQSKYLVDHLARAHGEQELPDPIPYDTTEDGPVNCDICNESFENSTMRATHVARVHSEPDVGRSFACEVCSKLFKTYQNLVTHMWVHSEKRPYKCLQCDKGYKRRSDLVEHVSRVHAAIVVAPHIPCETCGRLFKTRRQMVEHRNTHTQARPHKCPQCDKRFNNVSNRRLHVQRVHCEGPKSFACDICGKLYKTRRDQLDHSRSHVKPTILKCPHCDKLFKNSSNRNSHVTRVHTQMLASIPCEFCDKLFKNRPDLVSHMRTHSQDRPYKCPHCDKGFSRPGDRKSHVSRIHGSLKVDGPTEKPPEIHKCPTCEYETPYKHHLASHMDVVHGDGPGRFTCETCGKRCISRNTLERHNRTHTGEKPYKCVHCPFACGQKATLNRHVNSLHSDSSVRCKTCYTTFASEALLEKHQLIHEKKPFECPYCRHRTALKKDVVKHIKAVHSTEKPI